MGHDEDLPLIICFGDSLTVGYQTPAPDYPTLRETPYGAFLQERIGPLARVVVSGVCGEVTGEMTLRFRRDVLDHKADSVVILGGTNDLGWNADPAEIMRNLVQMYEQALAGGVQPVAVTVPSIRLDATTDDTRRFLLEHIVRRQRLNTLVSAYCARKGVACVDLFTATAEEETLSLAARYSNDGLHLTTEGYSTLAGLLYERVFASRFGSHQSTRGSGQPQLPESV